MGVNIVKLANGETLVDMSDATITPETVLEGYVGYGADGEAVVGTASTTKRIEVNVTLPASDWADNTQTVSVDGATAMCTTFVGGDLGSEPQYSEFGVWCSGQGDGTLTFSCTTTPDEDLVANVVIFT